MNTSIKIAGAELRTLFYSPIAWFLTIIFIFQSGLSFTSILEENFKLQSLGGGYENGIGYLTMKLFGRTGLFGEVAKKVYLYLPLLTMGLISRETSSGTIKLLYSSPIKIREIVTGKFLAMMAYNLLLVIILSSYVVIGNTIIAHASLTTMLCGLLGVFLIFCTYAAIGLFMSCLTNYQVIAALSTLVVFAILNYIGTVWQNYEFVRSLTYFLSISSRAEHMFIGYISSKDVVYFLAIIGMFLTFAYLKMEGERQPKPFLVNVMRYVVTFCATLFIGYLSTMPRFIISYDGTPIKLFTLHPNVKKYIGELGDYPLEITTYVNLLDRFVWIGIPSQRNRDLDRWEPYLRAKNNITLKYVYYYDYPADEQNVRESNQGKSLKEIAEHTAKNFDMDLADCKSPEEMRQIIDLSGEENSYVSVLKYRGKSTTLRLFNDLATFPTETEVVAALKRLTVPVPKIAFVSGQLERGRSSRAYRDYGGLTNGLHMRNSLMNQGFDSETILLTGQEIPGNLTALVIADPKTEFSIENRQKIQRYIDAGGNLLICGEPGKQAVLNPVLAGLGVRIMDGQIVQDDNLAKKTEVVLPARSVAVSGPGGKIVGPQGRSSGPISMGSANQQDENTVPYEVVRTGVTAEAAQESRFFRNAYNSRVPVTMTGVAALNYKDTSGFTVKKMLVSDTRLSWIKKNKLVADSAAVAYSSADGDEHGSFPTALLLTRKINGKQQRIVVSGDADFLSNKGLFGNTFGAQSNETFGIGIFSWFANGEFPVDADHPPMLDKRFVMNNLQFKAMKISYLGVLPGLLLIAGSIFLIRRKRK
ncbi:Gldg family protein [Pedobacter sp. AW31-3R]|uniref:Gldg family protein n=1 Tax=Pedobacter sp. AW31-3R TaxID=3445781 RepID=UPI003F9FF3F0